MRRGIPIAKPESEPWSTPDLILSGVLISIVVFTCGLVLGGFWMVTR